jgi:hypothetical protein
MALARRLRKRAQPLRFDEQLAQLQRLYEFIEPNEVIEVLHAKPRVVKLLREAQREIERYIPGSELTLEREEGTEGKEIRPLRLTVYPPEEMTDTSARIRKFKEKWYLKVIFEIKGDFYVTYDYPSKGSAWDAFKNLVGKVEMPEDWSAETDHYLHGAPKRHNKKEETQNVQETSQKPKS